MQVCIAKNTDFERFENDLNAKLHRIGKDYTIVDVRYSCAYNHYLASMQYSAMIIFEESEKE